MKCGLTILAIWLTSTIWSQLPANMYGDSAHAPFYHGVTSGDPLANQVIIWTRISSANATETVNWELSAYPDFSWIKTSGSFVTDTSKDYTVKVDVTGLDPSTIYYYRFKDALGNTSATGTTRTSPLSTDIVSHIRFAITSCTSIYSGFFNGYRRISERQDIDFVMHVGDYIYDFVDEDEEVRVPTPYPSTPTSLQEWRDRHTYYLLDPDLRAARQKHPWIVVWDNHDLSSVGDPDFIESQQAFYEYLPIRVPDPADSTKIWRKFSYGALMEVFMVDILTKRDIDLVTPSEYHILGQEQDFWLRNGLLASPARWKVVGNQKMIADWSTSGLPSWFPGSGGVLTSGTWDGYDAARDALLNFIGGNSISNVVFMTGDSHLTMVADLCDDPFDFGTYDGATGAGSVACEFLPTSITRGNFDEMGIDPLLLPLAEGLSNGVNPHHVHSEFISHGYGVVDVTPDTLIAELWYSDILSQTSTESFNDGYYVLNGMNHWERGSLNSPTSAKDTTYLLSLEDKEDARINLFPVPTKGMIYLVGKESADGIIYSTQSIEIHDIATGKLVKQLSWEYPRSTIEIDVTDLAAGNYVLSAPGRKKDQYHRFKFIKLSD